MKAVALARLAAPNVPSIQIDWLRYGPKLAQVALTFGADDLDNVTASDEAPDGRRRAPLEECGAGSRQPASCRWSATAVSGSCREPGAHRRGWVSQCPPADMGTDRSPDRWRVRYDVPSVCSALLHAGEVDLGLIPSVEYLQALSIAWCRASASARAGRSRRSRSSRDGRSHLSGASRWTQLSHLRCARQGALPLSIPHRAGIRSPRSGSPGHDTGLRRGAVDWRPRAGSRASDDGPRQDRSRRGMDRDDGLPFVYAAWTGRPGAIRDDDVRALQQAQREGVTATEAIAADAAATIRRRRPVQRRAKT